MTIFLHGGGGLAESFQPFVSQCKRIVLILVSDAEENDLAAYQDILVQAGAKADNLDGIIVNEANPLDVERITEFEADGIFICGGETPRYHALLCQNNTLATLIKERGLHVCGTSAGAAISSTRAIIGGWQKQVNGKRRQILFQGAGEGLDLLELRDGLGLVPFAIDVHASQWGTLTRLIHAVEIGLLDSGYAIDENTMLIADTLAVHGEGQVYRVEAAKTGQVMVTIMNPE